MSGKVFDLDAYKAKGRQAVAEGVVLLKNDREALPLAAGTKIALFGRSQYNYYKSGTGSGGMVNVSHVTSVKEALEKDDRFTLNPYLKDLYDTWIKDHPYDKGQGWGQTPWHQEEMVITSEIAAQAAEDADVAIILIGRTAGEDQDNLDAEGSWLLTADEREMLANVTRAFDRTIVLLNVGNIIDMSWVAEYDPAAVAYIWQGGQEGGNGVLDVLSGDVNPSGHLPDTIAKSIADYPSTKNFGGTVRNIQQEDIYVGYRYFETFAKDRVLYPFGYGLSYTTFDMHTDAFSVTDEMANVTVTVENTGKCAGRDVVQIYLEAPQGKLGQPARKLVGFRKTSVIAAGERETLTIEVPVYEMATYDDSGVTGHKSAYVLETGTYTFYVGDNVRDAAVSGTFSLGDTVVIQQLSEAMAPLVEFERMKPRENADGTFKVAYEKVPLRTVSGQKKRAEHLPKTLPQTGDKGIRLVDVADGKASMEDFIAQMTDEDLSCIVRGEGMSSPKVTPGTGGAIGGVTDSLQNLGIPVACVTDGPSGIRMDSGNIAFSMPIGTCLASTWDETLQEELYGWEGLELRKNHIDALLGPGMNIHRNPLNGRNFEYFSEDPFLTGKCAAAQLHGMQKYGVTGTIKHFCMNTQEAGRHKVEHVASERAIREIYLRGFEIAVKEGGASSVMTTYGPVNGFWTSSHYDLVTQILRNEWGFTGIAMTDWWSMGNDEGKPGSFENEAAMIRAQNDLNMVTASAQDNTTHDNTMEALAAGTVTRGEYQRSAANICRWIITKPVFLRYTDRLTDLDRQLDAEKSPEETAYDNAIALYVPNDGKPVAIDPAKLDTTAGSSNLLSVKIQDRGIYTMNLRLRVVAEGDLAQVPLTISRDGNVVKVISLTGADRDWQDISVELGGPCTGNFYVKLFFAETGMEIESISITLTRSMEVQIQAAIQAMMGGDDSGSGDGSASQDAPFYSMDTPVNLLMADEKFMAELKKIAPQIADNSMIRGFSMSFNQLVKMADGMVPDGVFDAIQEILKKLDAENR